MYHRHLYKCLWHEVTVNTSHYPKDVPWVLPEGWIWTTLGTVCHIAGRIGFRGYTKADLVKENGAITLSPSNIVDGFLDFSHYTMISWEKYDESPEIQVKVGDILLVKTGSSYGKAALVDKLPLQSTINPQFVVLKHILCDKYYLTHLLQSGYAKKLYDDFVLGTAIPTFTQKALNEMLVPLPPLSEQKRIVTAIIEWYNHIFQIEKAESALQIYIDTFKAKILDLAIHGKLLPQDPSDEPAIEIVKRINPAFQSSHNLHYEGVLPVGWVICRLEDILDYEQPQAYIVKSTEYSDSYCTPVLTPGKSFILGYTNESNGICKTLPVIIFDDFTTESKYVDFPFKVKSSAMKILRTKGGIDIRYVAFFMSTTKLAGDTHKRYWISEYSKMCIPLPPVEEQRRIVAAITNINKQLELLIADTL